MNSIILRAGTRYLAGLLLLFSIYMLLRGHNQPGGGFIGGLTGATGFVLYAIACGTSMMAVVKPASTSARTVRRDGGFNAGP